MQITVSFDPEVDYAEDVAERVAWAYGYQSVEDLLPSEDGDDGDGNGDSGGLDGWTATKMKKFALALKPTARKVLRAIAEGAPETTVESIQSTTGLEPSAFAGSMSSFGYAVNNTRGVRDKPYTKNGQVYSMTAPIAELVLRVLDDNGL
ncbi:hypothetical protein [Rhodococcus sp. NCIMB 12038]|uniref:hypothetical protein n=1 Tax=Rhodococcus sp. NCIMB 12038 TaxID=933800 RepID=UPI000B3C3318|nr:hypothetical protein [Rhodococcus sp. NCIMB 12038]OUS97292.1 hypothetical protein CA951_02800 [Rhodococcus sp. NCIMB 12038]